MLSPAKQAALQRLLAGESPAPQPSPAPLAGERALTQAEQRLWFLHQLTPTLSAYNIPLELRLHGPLDRKRLEKSIAALVERHAALRTVFDAKEPIARITATQPFTLGAPVPHAEPFDLVRGPLYRFALSDDAVLHITLHHLIADAWSLGVLLRDLAALYSGVALPPAALPTRGRAPEPDTYWRKQLAGMPETTTLLTDYARPARESHRGARIYFTVSREQTEALRAVSREHGVTLFMTLLSAFQVLLQQHRQHPEVVIGTPHGGRDLETEDAVGFFVNTLVLRSQVRSDQTVAQLLQAARTLCIDAFSHAQVPIESLVAEQADRSLSYNPLFQIFFALQNTPLPALKVGDLTIEPLRVDPHTALFDLFLSLQEGDALEGFFEYASDLFLPQSIAALANQYQAILAAFPRAQTVADLRPPPASEERGTQTRVTPFVTYCSVDTLARALAAAGCGPGSVVAICADRSPEFLRGVQAVLVTGACYVPVDPDYPRDRIAYILADSGASYVLADKRATLSLPTGPWRALGFDAQSDAPFSPPPIDPESLAYIIYTSGSTGQPKGVEIPHRALSHFVAAIIERLSLTADDVFVSLTTTCFDISALELLVPLALGARIVYVPDARDGAHLLTCVKEATVVQATPTTWRMLLAAGLQRAEGKRFLVGGEPVPSDLAAALRATGAQVWNVYGPTETTIWSSAGPLTDDIVHIGSALGETRLVVLVAAIGVPGELCIGGPGVARGYHGLPELTAQKFITFNGERYFKTGDIVRRLGDGRLVHLGRADDQIKLRGFRIELGEIESLLRAHPWVLDAGVSLQRGDEDRLVAHVVLDNAQREQELPARLDDWQAVWDETYRMAPETGDPALATAGWNDSTGVPIPDDEMRLWAEQTAERILALKPKRVLEVGVGTGMVLYRVAPHVEHYVACDFSEVALQRLSPPENVTLLMRGAHELAGLGAFDVVILNSVIQYFPNAAYLERVLESLEARVVFVGDVRDLRLSSALCSAAQLASADDQLPRKQLLTKIAMQSLRDQELRVAPKWFEQYAAKHASHAHYMSKSSSALDNEIAAFRYDVLLSKEPLSLRTPLQTSHRLQQALAIVEALNDERLPTVAAIRQRAGMLRGLTIPEPTTLISDPLQVAFERTAASELRAHLRDKVPEYMIPAQFVAVDALPLTLNGKLDRKRLAAPAPAASAHYVPATTDRERTLVTLWEQVLGVSPIGVNDNFFDLGGASLSCVRLVTLAQTQGLALTVELIFMHPTVRSLGEAL